MNLGSLLAIGGGILGLASGGDTLSQLSSGAAIVSGVAGMTGNSNLAKIAGVASLGAGAYDYFSGGSMSEIGGDSPKSLAADPTSAINTAPNTGISLASDSGGPSGNGNSFSDARSSAQSGMDYNGGLSGPSDVPTAQPNVALGGPTSSSTGSIAPAGGTSLFDQAKSVMGGVPDFLKGNKELVTMAGGALNGMFGPQAKQVSILQQRQKMQQDEINRQNANSNNVTALSLPVAPNPNGVVRRV